MAHMQHPLVWTLSLALLAGCAKAPQPTGVALASGGARAAGVVDWAQKLLQSDAATFKAHDRNHDGSLSPDELPDLPAAAFESLDANHDGKLSQAEATAQAPSLESRVKVALDFARAATLGGTATSLVNIEIPNGPDVDDQVEALGPLRAGANPVVMVPGYLDLSLYFAYLKHRLNKEGRDTTYCELFPNIGDIRVSAGVLRATIARVRARTGAAKVDLLAHSEGGLISRYFIENMMDQPCVDHLVTLATPNHGTIDAYLGPGMGARQMQPGSDFLKTLNSPDQAPEGIKCTSIRAGLDEIIIPHDSPILAGAENDLVPIAEHASIFVVPQAVAFVEAGLAR